MECAQCKLCGTEVGSARHILSGCIVAPQRGDIGVGMTKFSTEFKVRLLTTSTIK